MRHSILWIMCLQQLTNAFQMQTASSHINHCWNYLNIELTTID